MEPARFASAPARAVLVLACTLFVALGYATSERMTVFAEELIMVPMSPQRVLGARPGPDGNPREQPSCRDVPHAALLLSADRPNLSLCLGARRFPIMVAPHFAGFFLWPIELLRPLHGGDPIVVRKLLLSLGVLSLVLGYRVTVRFGTPRLAAFGALATAVSPTFVGLSSIVQQFETLPWIFVLCAALTLSRCPQLVPREGTASAPPSTTRLALAALFTGLAVVANVKAVFFVAPLVVLAWRLGARVRAIAIRQWISMAIAFTAAVFPLVLPIAMDRSMRWAQGRGSSWKHDLVVNLGHPAKVLAAARDLVLMGSNFGAYLTGASPSWPAVVVASLVFAFVLADTARTLVRGEGDVVTAACGVILFSYLGVVTLLYVEFPANFTPLHAVYGLSLGCAADRLVSAVRGRVPVTVAVVVASLVFVPFVASTLRSMDILAEIPFVTNAHAERELVAHLESHPEPRSVTFTVNLLVGGVLDALSRGRIETVQAHPWLGECEHGDSDADRANCFSDRFTALLRTHPDARVVRFVMPASLGFVHRPPSLLPLQLARLERAAHTAGFTFALERVFTTPSGRDAARLYRLERTSPAP